MLSTLYVPDLVFPFLIGLLMLIVRKNTYNTHVEKLGLTRVKMTVKACKYSR